MPVSIVFITLAFMQFLPFLQEMVCLLPSMQVFEAFLISQYVKPGKLPKDLARIYNDLFERRQESDYIDFVNFEESQVLPWIAKAEKLIKHISGHIDKQIK